MTLTLRFRPRPAGSSTSRSGETVAANSDVRNLNVPSNDGCKRTLAGEFDVCTSNLSSPSGAWSEKLTSSGELEVRVATVKAPLVLFSKVETKERSAERTLHAVGKK